MSILGFKLCSAKNIFAFVHQVVYCIFEVANYFTYKSWRILGETFMVQRNHALKISCQLFFTAQNVPNVIAKQEIKLGKEEVDPTLLSLQHQVESLCFLYFFNYKLFLRCFVIPFNFFDNTLFLVFRTHVLNFRLLGFHFGKIFIVFVLRVSIEICL